MTWLLFGLVLLAIFGMLNYGLRRHACRWWLSAAIVVLLGFTKFAKDSWGTEAPGTWFEKQEYKALALLHVKMLKSPFTEQVVPCMIHAKASSGGDPVGPMMRHYRLISMRDKQLKSIVLVKLENPVCIKDVSPSADDLLVTLLPGDPVVMFPIDP